ncbi:MAG: T9SS type A sorting domain-containing protein, partial [Cytophagales bacterium]
SGPDYVAIYKGDSLTSIDMSNYSGVNAFNIFPNPTENELNLELDKKASGKYCIYNDMGQLLLQGRFDNIKAIQISLKELPKGIYTIKIEESITSGSLRFVKQ